MRIKLYKLLIVGLQGYETETTFMFSNNLTIVKGNNSAGKTAIKRILKAYQEDISSSDTLRSLLNRRRNYGYADLTSYNVDTKEFITVRLYLYRNGKSINYYYEVYDGNLNVIFRTEYYDEQIGKYLGFENIPEPNGYFPLNFKDSNRNAFINTPILTNGFILDGLCFLADYEIRIANLKDVIVRITDVKREYNKELRDKLDDLSRETFTPTLEIEKEIISLEQKQQNLQTNYEILSITSNCIEQLTHELNLSIIENLLKVVNSAILNKSVVASKEAIFTNETLEITLECLNTKLAIAEISNVEKSKSEEKIILKYDEIIAEKLMLKQSVLQIQHSLNFDFIDSIFHDLTKIKTSLEFSTSIKDYIYNYKLGILIDSLLGIIEDSKTVAKVCYIQFLNNISEENVTVCDKWISTINSLIQYWLVYKTKMQISDIIRTDNALSQIDYLDNLIQAKVGLIQLNNSQEQLSNIEQCLELIPKCPTCGRASI